MTGGLRPGGEPATPAVEHPANTRPGDAVSPFKLASVLLQYPTTALFAGLAHLDAAARACPRGSREPLRRFLSWLRATPPDEVARH